MKSKGVKVGQETLTIWTADTVPGSPATAAGSVLATPPHGQFSPALEVLRQDPDEHGASGTYAEDDHLEGESG